MTHEVVETKTGKVLFMGSIQDCAEFAFDYPVIGVPLSIRKN